MDAAWVRFPDFSPWATVGAAIHAKYPEHWNRFADRLRRGAVVDMHGTPVDAETPLRRGMTLFYYRDLPAEEPVPFPISVLYQDENIVVADKPHFLATMPRGRHVTETATVRLRRQLNLPELTPAHRLDRLTAGVLVLTARAQVRGAYQELFARREAEKEYLALAAFRPALTLPLTRRSRISKAPGARQAHEIAGTPNAITHISLDAHDGRTARYRLRPETGRTHQIRIHMCALGIPIVGDPLYPEVNPEPAGFTEPLQLLARRLAFTDPITGRHHVFVSERELTLS